MQDMLEAVIIREAPAVSAKFIISSAGSPSVIEPVNGTPKIKVPIKSMAVPSKKPMIMPGTILPMRISTGRRGETRS